MWQDRIIAWALALALVVFPTLTTLRTAQAVTAQVRATVLSYQQPAIAASGYQGPGDVVGGATAWWGFRAYNAAYATGSNPGTLICDTATFAICTTINILSNGQFDTATAAASTSCATACVVKSFTDQTGNGHTLSCVSAATCGTLTFNCINTNLPCIAVLKANTPNYSIAGTTISVTTGFSLNAVVNFTAIGGTFQPLCCIAGSNSIAWGATSAGGGGTGYIVNGGTNQTFPLSGSTNHSYSAVFNGASSVAIVDATANPASPGTTGGTIGNIAIGGSLAMTGHIMEVGVWATTIFNSTQYGNICHNQFVFWATAISC